MKKAVFQKAAFSYFVYLGSFLGLQSKKWLLLIL